jgi:hypothetical protein
MPAVLRYSVRGVSPLLAALAYRDLFGVVVLTGVVPAGNVVSMAGARTDTSECPVIENPVIGLAEAETLRLRRLAPGVLRPDLGIGPKAISTIGVEVEHP